MKHLGTQEIKTKGLTLRRFTVEDAQAMYDNWASDPEVTRYLTWPTHGSIAISAMVLESWVKSYDQENFYQWAIEFEGRPVGSIAVVRMDDRTASAEVPLGSASTSFLLVEMSRRMPRQRRCLHSSRRRWREYTSTFCRQARSAQALLQAMLSGSCRL